MRYYRTSSPEVNLIVEGIVDLIVNFFNLDVISIYLLGSYTDDSAIGNSDIDMAVVYRKNDDEQIRKIKEYLSIYSRGVFMKEIDLYLVSYDQLKQLDQKSLLTREGILNVKIASKIVFGEDVRDEIVIPSVESYIEMTYETPFHFMKKVRGLGDNDELFELTYPDSNDAYYGYLSFVSDTHQTLESKPLLSLIGWICTSLIAIKSGVLVGKKSDVARLYKKHVNDIWNNYVFDAYRLIRSSLNYGFPIAEYDKDELRNLCEQTLNFERYYIDEFKKYKLGKKQSNR